MNWKGAWVSSQFIAKCHLTIFTSVLMKYPEDGNTGVLNH